MYNQVSKLKVYININKYFLKYKLRQFWCSGPANSNESDSSEHFEDAASPLTSIKQNNSNIITGNDVKTKLLCNVNVVFTMILNSYFVITKKWKKMKR